jgi:hypothetical protein
MQAPGEGRPDMQRAEQMVDSLGRGIGDLSARLSFRLLKAAARAREEAEDIWAEARSMSRGSQI